MSWWDTDNDDDVMGDQPADLVRHSLQQIVEARERSGLQKPTLVDLLQAIGIVARSNAETMLAKVPKDLRGIAAVLKSDQTVSSGPLKEDEKTKDLISTLTENLHAIRDVYKERWERDPRFSEWLYAIEFVIRSQPEEFLSDGVDHPPAKLNAETGTHTNKE